MSSEKQPPAKKQDNSDKKARLAEKLRQNLRRRKAAPRPKKPSE